MKMRNDLSTPGDVSLMPLGDHLEDLRRRLIYAMLGILPVVVVTLWFGKALLGVIVAPAIEALRAKDLPVSFQVLSFFEGFNAYLKVSLGVSIMVGAPWVFYQLWRFIAPGLLIHERRFVYVLSPLSAVLTLCSALFLYFVMLPVVLLFFVTFNSSLPAPVPDARSLPPGVTLPVVPMFKADPIAPPEGSWWVNTSLSQLRFALPDRDESASGEVSADAATAPRVGTVIRGVPLTGDQLISQQYQLAEYVSMVVMFTLALALGFQMPVVVLLLGWARILSVGLLTKFRRHAMLVCLILGAVLTPADPLSMMLLAVPLWLLFELGVMLLRWLPAARLVGESQEEPPM